MRLLKRLWVVMTSFVMVLFGIVAGKPSTTGGSGNANDSRKSKEDSKEKEKNKKGKKGSNPKQRSEKTGRDPVDYIHGLVFYDVLDFEYPGVIPFEWTRSWNSGNARLGALGYGTGSLFTMYIRSGKEIAFINEQGREIFFAPPWDGEPSINREEKLSLTSGLGKYEIFDYEKRLRYVFSDDIKPKRYRLTEIENETRDHKIVLEYKDESILCGITDTAGRYFKVDANKAGLIKSIRYDGRTLVEYAYDDLLNLIEVTDIHGVKTTMFYQDHLMVKRITKNGDIFQWEYDDDDENARCLHTWGENGLLEGWFEYNDDHTVLTDSLGYKEIFYFDEKKQLTRYIDANNAETLYTYSAYGEIESVTNPDGETTKYAYNDFGQITKVTLPNTAVESMEYDEASRLIKSIAPNGAESAWEYDKQGHVAKSITPTGAETFYTYNNKGMVSQIIEGVGEKQCLTEFAYDESLNLLELKYPNGAVEKWEYDKSGNCVKNVSPLGAMEEMAYDDANRIVKYIAEDGVVTHLAYNPYDDVIQLYDDAREINYEYTALGDVSSRKEQNLEIKMDYDTEGRLFCVENEAGEKHIFSRDGMGNVITETGYNGVVKSYEYSPGGKLTGLKRGETAGFTTMIYGADGQLSEIEYDNGDKETFTHGKMGEILTAINKDVKLSFEYDLAGRQIKETQNGITVESGYSAEFAGRTGIKTSFGLNVDMRINKYGQTEEITAGFQDSLKYHSCIAYNALEQIAERTVNTSGGVIIKDSWSYDRQGRPVSQSVTVNNRESNRRQYNWGTVDRLKSIIDNIDGIGKEYSYDKYGIPEFEKIKVTKSPKDVPPRARYLDNAGNIYETKDRSDRKYDNGGQLVVSKGRKYIYNDCGDLVEKEEPDGTTWSYIYHPSGLLSKVVRPDGNEVSFIYDSLGRRVSKEFDGKVTKFLWDGDKIVHEWVEEGDYGNNVKPFGLSTWLFDEDSFAPLAKLTDKQTYSVISNHLGTPITMLNNDGKTVWKAELDIYGEPFFRDWGNTEETNCPFRFPGQYEDVETGLYYNRFRYYDAAIGLYTQQDPIGLLGGLLLYGYVHDPNIWVDIFGLSRCKSQPRRTKHTENRHVNRKKYPTKSKYAKPSQRMKLENRTMSNPSKVTNQRNGRILYQKQYGRTIGTRGETVHRVVLDPIKNKIVTSFPALSLL